jgi:pilus assembly protein FimV
VPEAAKKPPAAPTPPTAAQTPPPSEAQLKVIAPPSADATKSAGSAGTGETTPAAGSTAPADIPKELALATEAVETQRQETQDLRTRLSDLEQQISTMQKMMTIKDEQLASMQEKNKNAAAASASAESQQETGALSNPATLAMIGIVAVVLAALLWLALRRRQFGAPGMQREIRVEPRQSAAPAAAPVRTAPAAVAAGAVTAAAVRAANKNVESVSTTPQQAIKRAAEQHTDSDPLSEADIYLAYGRYQQAEDLIKEAMRHDQNPELRLKLLEIYYAAKNATAFEDTARDLRHDVGAGHELWHRALLMGREICPYSLLFSEDQSDESAAADTEHAASAATAPDSHEFDPGGGDDTVVAPGRFKQEPVGHGGELAEDTLDEVGTKLDLARAYIDMGDMEGARSILGEVLQEGSTVQKDEAQGLLQKLTH